METKICNKCGIEKDKHDFYANSKRGKYSNTCKKCELERQKQYREENKVYIHKLERIRKKNRQREKERMKKVKEHNLRILINRYSSLTKDK